MKLPKDKKVYVVGMSGLEEELRDEGISILGGTASTLTFRTGRTHNNDLCIKPQDPADKVLGGFSLEDWTPDPAVGAVLCGLDTSMNYTKYSKAFQYLLQNPDCKFLATNTDSTYPTAHGLLPGAGSISAPLRFALGRDPLSIGKPAGTMLECIKAK